MGMTPEETKAYELKCLRKAYRKLVKADDAMNGCDIVIWRKIDALMQEVYARIQDVETELRI